MGRPLSLAINSHGIQSALVFWSGAFALLASHASHASKHVCYPALIEIPVWWFCKYISNVLQSSNSKVLRNVVGVVNGILENIIDGIYFLVVLGD